MVRNDRKGELNVRWGYIDNTGRLAIEPRFYSPESFSGELAQVLYVKGWGYRYKYWYGWIDKTGTTVNKPYFDKAYSFSEGLANVDINDKYGFIDQSGKLVIELQFDIAGSFSEGLALIGVAIAKKEEK